MVRLKFALRHCPVILIAAIVVVSYIYYKYSVEDSTLVGIFGFLAALFSWLSSMVIASLHRAEQELEEQLELNQVLHAALIGQYVHSDN